mmetsp:Transcript_6204/g.12822  ORF Transcript_6204/g.12822 Transcript_6204/m.12822 type:complete len:101 (+) Transcript_6204:450-752(+)
MARSKNYNIFTLRPLTPIIRSTIRYLDLQVSWSKWIAIQKEYSSRAVAPQQIRGMVSIAMLRDKRDCLLNYLCYVFNETTVRTKLVNSLSEYNFSSTKRK